MARAPRLSHDASTTSHNLMLGCAACAFRQTCGGLVVANGLFDCFANCCGGRADCDVVCPKRPDAFVNHIREVGGLDLAEGVPRSPSLHVSPPAGFSPLLQHSKCRSRRLAAQSAALSIYEVFKRGTPELKYANRQELDDVFQLNSGGALVLSGTAKDAPLERWWLMGTAGRRKAAAELKKLNPAMVTTPNFSLFVDQPRTDDLHSMKRISIAWEEFNSAGVPCALHVNARTDFDYARWGQLIADRPEIKFIASEFATGGRYAARAAWHVSQLCALAKIVGRPLGLVVRGGWQFLPSFVTAFASIHLVETGVFMKTMKRQQLTTNHKGSVVWAGVTTEPGAPLDDLLDQNLEGVSAAFQRQLRRAQA